MIRRSCWLAPYPQLIGCLRPTRCQQFFLSVPWLLRWAVCDKVEADRVAAGNFDTMLLNPVLRQSVSINSSGRGRSREVEHLLMVVDFGL
jgi:hypothetical protein